MGFILAEDYYLTSRGPQAVYTETSVADLCTLMARGNSFLRLSKVTESTVVDIPFTTDVKGYFTVPTPGQFPM